MKPYIFIKAHHELTFGESCSCSVTSWQFSLSHTWQLCWLLHTH